MGRSRHLLRAAFALALVTSAASAAAPAPRVWIHHGGDGFHADVVDTPRARQKGLMGRTRLGDDEAMLFVFEDADRHCFWMKRTPIPLSVAFLADDGTIVGIADMEPDSETQHCAPRPVRLALEVRAGGFARKGMTPGTRLSGQPFR